MKKKIIVSIISAAILANVSANEVGKALRSIKATSKSVVTNTPLQLVVANGAGLVGTGLVAHGGYQMYPRFKKAIASAYQAKTFTGRTKAFFKGLNLNPKSPKDWLIASEFLVGSGLMTVAAGVNAYGGYKGYKWLTKKKEDIEDKWVRVVGDNT